MSFNSESKSKRSFNSISSNPGSSSNNSSGGDVKGKKKKKTALGVAWGSNSLSSSRSASRNSPFPDFGSYMAVKNRKLQDQFDAAASGSSDIAAGSGMSIFSGVAIFVDGYTVPSNQELRGYMLKHGGRFENYFSRHRVTHIICSNLPDSKIKNFRAFSGGLPVVKPTWVLDCVAANKLLNWTPYQLDQLAGQNNNQPKLSAFFPLNNSRVPQITDPHVNDQDTPENDISLLEKTDPNLSEENSASELEDRCSIEPNESIQSGDCNGITEKPSCSTESSCEPKRVELSEISPLDEKNPAFELVSSTPEAHVHKSPSNDNYQSSSSKTVVPSDQQHSTLTDPNFVENYFKSSRLHFIGTWRNRYRKRFARTNDGSRSNNSSLNSDALAQNIHVIHIDMDSFFVSVVIRNRPELQGKPVAVSHSDNRRGTAEISSANYPARNHGVKAGMFVRDAKILCPQLVIVPYDFEAYEKVADQFYDILHKHCNKVQAVSCDEAFVEVSESEVHDPQLLASKIRKEIIDTTGCTASAGIAGNMLMARLATKTAKPDGQCYIPPEEVDNYLCRLPVKALPGIGHVLEEKLKKKHIETCAQLREITKESLQRDFGMKTGEMLWNYSRGIDNRLVGLIQESKSIGAEVNWGVRFQDLSDTRHFLVNLCKEVSLRLQGCRAQGRSFTLKIKKRRSDAGEPVKYMGCGDCENLSHSITIPMATDDVDVLQRLATQLFGYFNIDVKDIRGMGLQVSKLEGIDDSKPVLKRKSILSWFVSDPTKASDSNKIFGIPNHGKADSRRLRELEGQGRAGSIQTGDGSSSSGVGVPATLPPLQDLDMAVLQSLPPEVVSEINDMYGGKLLGLISENKGRTLDTDIKHASIVTPIEAVEQTESVPAHLVRLDANPGSDQELHIGDHPTLAESAGVSLESLMPASLSQVDRSVLQQLPQELRDDIIEFLPQHRRMEMINGATTDAIDNHASLLNSTNDLWIGSPPRWVHKFEISSCEMLKAFAKIYRSRTGGGLSSALQRMISASDLSTEMGTDELNDAFSWLSELFKQYIELIVATDIEEIYFFACLLQRLAGRSRFFLQVYNAIVPHLQASVGDEYGGTLHVPS